MRSVAIGFAVVFLAGMVGVAALGLSLGSSLAYSLGVNPATVAATLEPGDRACQAPIRPPTGTEFDRVGFLVATFGEPGPPLGVEVRDDSTGRRLETGRLRDGYADFDAALREHVVSVGRVDVRTPLRVCIVNEGTRPAGVIGQDGVASPSTTATLEGEPLTTDLGINLREDRQSLIARLPEMAERAARFRGGWVGPPLYLAVALALVLGAPVMITRGLRRQAESSAR